MVDVNDAVLDGKAELFFPAYLIPSLRDLRGDSWRELVDRVSMLSDTHPDSLAFVLMMINLGDCMKCHSNYYKFCGAARSARCRRSARTRGLTQICCGFTALPRTKSTGS